MKLSKLAETMPASAPLAYNNAVKARISEGAEIFNFTIGDFDPSIFPIPQVLEDEIVKAYHDKQTNYPAAEGNADLRIVLAAHIQRFQHLQYHPSEILVTAGGRPIIYAAYQTLIDPGDKIIFPVPSWNNTYYTQLSGGKACAVETSAADDFMLTADSLKPHIKDAVLIALCSPQNPTGTCYTYSQMRAITDLVVEENNRRNEGQKKLFILYDHIYNLLMHDGVHVDPVSVKEQMKPYTIYMDAMSKGFAATGIRVGWGYGPKQVIEKMKIILTHVGAWAPMAEQKGVAAFLNQPEVVRDFLAGFNCKITERLNAIYYGILSLKEEGFPVDVIAPQASIYLTIKIDMPGDITAILLESAGIAVLPLSAFGSAQHNNWFRISVGTCKLDDIQTMLEKLKATLVNCLEHV